MKLNSLIMADRRRLVVAFILAAAVFAIPFTFTYVAPRPYGIKVNDVEADYYYNGMLLAYGYPLNGDKHFQHPGTPIQLLNALLIRAIGNGPERTQIVLDTGRMIMGIVIAASLALFVFLLPKGTPASVALFIGMVIVTAPPFVSQLDYFGVDPFLVPPTLIALALLWKEIIERQHVRKGILAISGVLLGLASAIKLSALPVAIGMFCAMSIILYPSIRHKSTPWWFLVILPSATSLAFVFFTIPIIPYYPLFIEAISTQLSGIPFFAPSLREKILVIGSMFPIFSVIGLFSIIAAAVLIVEGRTVSRRAIFLFFLFLSFFYFVTKIGIGNDLTTMALETRYIIPSYLVIAFCIHYIFQERRYDARFIHVGLVAASLLIYILPVGGYIAVRNGVVKTQMLIASQLDDVLEYYDADTTDSGRAALWFSGGGEVGYAKPETTFHLWGNEKYGSGKFTKEILEFFPNETYFDYIAAWRYAGDYPVVKGKEVIWGETQGVYPSLFLFPVGSVLTTSHFGWPSNQSQPSELKEFLVENYQDVSIPQDILRFLVKNFGGGIDVLKFLSERYKKSLLVFPIEIANHTWIVVAEKPPPSEYILPEE